METVITTEDPAPAAAPAINVTVNNPATPEGASEWHEKVLAQLQQFQKDLSEVLTILAILNTTSIQTQQTMESLLAISEAETLEPEPEPEEIPTEEASPEEEEEGPPEVPAAPAPHKIGTL
jgi:hypothetical protein